MSDIERLRREFDEMRKDVFKYMERLENKIEPKVKIDVGVQHSIVWACTVIIVAFFVWLILVH